MSPWLSSPHICSAFVFSLTAVPSIKILSRYGEVVSGVIKLIFLIIIMLYFELGRRN